MDRFYTSPELFITLKKDNIGACVIFNNNNNNFRGQSNEKDFQECPKDKKLKYLA